MRLSSLAAVAAVVARAFASPGVPLRLHEKRTVAPPEWIKRSTLNLTTVIPVRIALQQQNLHNAEKFLFEVSNPRSENYGRHWDARKVAETFAPSKTSIKTVMDWLHNSGIDAGRIKLSQGMNWLQVNATISEAQALLKTEYYIYEHSVSRVPQVACHEYHLPPHIAPHVDFITPTVHFDTPMNIKHRRSLNKRELTQKRPREIRKRTVRTLADAHEANEMLGQQEVNRIRPGAASEIGTSLGSLPKQGATLADDAGIVGLDQCDDQITPACLRALYGFNESTEAQPKNSFGVVEYAPQTFIQADLDKYFGNFSKDIKSNKPILASIDGGFLLPNNRSFDINGESDLDLQFAMALVAPQPVTLYQVGDAVEGASFNNFLDAVDGDYCKFEGGDDKDEDAIFPDPTDGYIGPANCGGFVATKVISTSYGFNEADLTEPYVKRQCSEYLKLALQGVTVLYSSGDFGVAGNMGRCIDPSTGNYTRTNASEGVFNPSFPSGCPWVTSVGATQVPKNTNIVRSLATSTQPETACETVIRSGGGFSNIFPLPEYQTESVKKWFADSPPKYGADRFNNTQTTRGFPDISVNGANYVVAVDGNFTLLFGTSASAPTLGSIITMINGERMKAGKSSVGFINQVLYEHPDILKDVTSGTNRGCGTDGFSAAPGWDPLTGLGTPIYPKMLDLFMSLP